MRTVSPALRHASLQDIAHAELTPDLPHVDGLAFVGEARLRAITNSHLIRDRPVMMSSNHAVGEIFLVRVAAHVLERQDRDRRPVGQGEAGRGLFGRGWLKQTPLA